MFERNEKKVIKNMQSCCAVLCGAVRCVSYLNDLIKNWPTVDEHDELKSHAFIIGS